MNKNSHQQICNINTSREKNNTYNLNYFTTLNKKKKKTKRNKCWNFWDDVDDDDHIYIPTCLVGVRKKIRWNKVMSIWWCNLCCKFQKNKKIKNHSPLGTIKFNKLWKLQSLSRENLVPSVLFSSQVWIGKYLGFHEWIPITCFK